MVGCLDLDAFFVAVERVKDPSLRGRPVIVGGNPAGRGVVCSASYEARAFGVHSAMPSATALRLCPDAIFLRPDGEAITRYSLQVAEILSLASPLVEQASVDEFFFSLDGCERLYRGDLFSVAGHIRREIRDLGLTASVGFASSRTLAKVASNLAKPDGQLHILPGEEASFLAPLPLRLIPGVGRRSLERLQNLGLHTAEDLQAVPDRLLGAALGKAGEILARKARGEGSAAIHQHWDQRGFSNEDTLKEDTTDLNTLHDLLFWLTERAAHRMRKKGFAARTVTIKLRYADFVTVTRSHTVPHATDEYGPLRRRARDLFGALYTRRLRVRLLGVSLTNLSAERQPSLIRERQVRLEKAVDAIRQRHGLRSASLGR